MLSGVSNCLPCGNPVVQTPSLQSRIFIHETTGIIYTYDYANKLFMLMGKIDHDTAEDMQRNLINQNQKCLKFTAASWTYQTTIYSPLSYIE